MMPAKTAAWSYRKCRRLHADRLTVFPSNGLFDRLVKHLCAVAAACYISAGCWWSPASPVVAGAAADNAIVRQGKTAKGWLPLLPLLLLRA